MIIDRPQAKLAARNCMRTAQISPYQISLVYVLITFAATIFDSVTMNLFSAKYFIDSYSYISVPSPINWFITIFVSLILTILQAGLITYILGIRRGKQMPLSTLFDGFSIAGKVILLSIVTSIFITLWTMLLIIPGIIAAYRYRFALYNLLENPDMGIMDAINLSKQQTEGFKWQLFVLDLSFFGWLCVSLLTMNFLLIWLAPYMLLTNIAFYDAICEYKGMRVSDHKTEPVITTSPSQLQNSYNWNQQNNDQIEPNQPSVQNPSESNEPAAQNPPETSDTPAQAPSNLEVDSLFNQSAPKAPDVPCQNGEPWETKNNSEPWDQK